MIGWLNKILKCRILNVLPLYLGGIMVSTLDTGEHPSSLDNFQSEFLQIGNIYKISNGFGLNVHMVTETGDLRYNQINTGDYQLTNGFSNKVANSGSQTEQIDPFNTIQESQDFDEMKQRVR